MPEAKLVTDPCPYCGHPKVKWDSHLQTHGDHSRVIRYQICKRRWIVELSPIRRKV